MHRRSLTRHLPYTPDQLFQLVGDVESYPQFVPWLTSMRTWNAREARPGVTSVDAEAGVGFAFLTERFATRVTRDAEQRLIDVSLLYGPFRALSNQWRFHPEPGGSRVEFAIAFAFKSRLLDALLNANMDRAIQKLIGCFEARAAHLHAKVPAADAGSSPGPSSPAPAPS